MKPTYEELVSQLERSRRLYDEALKSEIAWEMAMMKACGEDGPASVSAKFMELQSQNADMSVQLANAESKCRELAAESVVLKKAAEFATAPDMWIEQADGMLDYRYFEWYVDVLKAAMETPATDAFLAEVLAQGVEMAACALDDVNQFNYANMLDDLAQKLRKGASL